MPEFKSEIDRSTNEFFALVREAVNSLLEHETYHMCAELLNIAEYENHV